MKISLKILPWTISLILFALLIIQQQCQRCRECPEITTDSIVIYDTLPYTPSGIIPKPATEIIQQPIPTNIDSLAIVQAYFQLRKGFDTLVNDSLYTMSLKWEVTQNKPVFYQPTIIDRKPTTYISHTIVEKPKWHFYGGFALAYSTASGQQSISPSIMLQSKKGHIYGLSYDLQHKAPAISMHWKLR